MDEPELPPLPRVRSTLLPPLTKKRTHAEYETNTSSDPALFSSDDHREDSAEAYTSKRCKEKWTGTWWGDRLRNTSTRAKRSIRRNYDSGIFMGSDGTDTSLEDEFLADQKANGDTEASSRASSPISAGWGYPLPAPRKIATLPAQTRLVSPGHYQAVAVIQTCLEAGSEDVDLSSLYLEALPSEILLLKSITKHHRIADPPASQEGYSSIEAQLRLYLSGNLLRQVPTSLLELDNLRLLSLRQNNLSHIPAGIRKLRQLKSLNLAANNLRNLPFEIVELFNQHSLVELVADPNPWEEWSPGQEDEARDEVSLTNQMEHLTGSHRCAKTYTGQPTFFRANGTPYLSSKAPAGDAGQSRTPHLTELVLRRLVKLPELSSIESAVVDEMPETAQRMISEVQDAQVGGGRQCTKCHGALVMPRKQWLEWWSIGRVPGASLIPFLRQQCHELCDGVLDTWTAKPPLP